MNHPQTQRGATLIVALVLTFTIGVLSVTAMRSSLNESEITTALEIENAAFAVAESAVMHAYESVKFSDLDYQNATQVQSTTVDNRINVNVTARQDGMIAATNNSLRAFGLASYSFRADALDTEIGTQRTVIAGAAQRVPLGR